MDLSSSDQDSWVGDKILEKSGRPRVRGIYEVHDQGPLAHLVADSSGMPTRTFRVRVAREKSRWDDLAGDDAVLERIEEARKSEYRAPVKAMPFTGDTIEQAAHHARLWHGRIDLLPDEVRKQMLNCDAALSTDCPDPAEIGTTTPPVTETPQE
jgi:hypothetical protein